ncbi:MAG TPA: MATE family efflux transporter [Geminicoccaceae bacterium]|nr:MATE family efflux transporter [Geminicoccus sp.]HMU52947.1 MATE family efflux transporter [Geminicoccaceae bacterium]
MSAYRECWRLAWPLILANLSVPLLGLVDTAVVGHLPGPHFLAGVALGAVVVGVLYFLFGFLRMGTTGLCAQALGAGDARELRAIPVRALMLSTGLGLAIALLAWPILAVSEIVFAPGQEVRDSLATYLVIRLLGAPAALGGFVVLGWLLGVQDSRGPLVLLVVTNAVNAALALLLVLGLGLGVAGVASATLVAEYVGLAAGLLLVWRRWRRIGLGRVRRAEMLVRERFWRLVVVNRDIFLRSAALEASFLGFAALGSRQGEVVLAANAVLMSFFTFSAYGLDGFAHAAEAMVGKAVGARDPAGVQAAARAGFGLAAGLAVAMTAAFALGGPALIALLTDLAEVRATALAFLPFAAALPLVSVWAFVLDGLFFGATRTAELRNATVAAMLAFAAAALVLPGPFGNSGLWSALLILMAARGAFLGLAYWRAGAGAAFARGPA